MMQLLRHASRRWQRYAFSTALRSNAEGDRLLYKFSVATGDERGAGATTNADVVLYGNKTNLEVKLSPVLGEFRRDSIESFDVEVADDIGEIEALSVRPDTELGSRGWYLKHIDVCLATITADEEHCSQAVRFLADRWLGVAHSSIDHIQHEQATLEPARHLSVVSGTKPFRAALLPKPLTLRYSASCCPHPNKVKNGKKGICTRKHGLAGEDSFSVSIMGTSSMLAVADGVFQWSFKDIDSGIFSSGLTNHIGEFFETAVSHRQATSTSPEAYARRPPRVRIPSTHAMFNSAWRHVQQKRLQGSATLCVATFDGLTGTLDTANLGDSGLIVFRDIGTPEAHVSFRTRSQEHRFGQPFQLGHHSASDHPWNASHAMTVLKEGDVIVVGTDGLWDNLRTSELLELFQKEARRWNCAAKVLKAAFDVSMNKNASSPWSEAATEELNFFYSGGKADDITVLIAEVVGAK